MGLTHHFNHFLAWEAVRAFTTDWETHLRELLIEDWGAEPEDFEVIQHAFISQLHLKPLYGKFALNNQRLIRVEAYLTTGGGIVFLTDRRKLPVVTAAVGFSAHTLVRTGPCAPRSKSSPPSRWQSR